MAGSKTKDRNAGKAGEHRKRFIKGTDTQVVRVMAAGGKKRFVWAHKVGDDFLHVATVETELR